MQELRSLEAQAARAAEETRLRRQAVGSAQAQAAVLHALAGGGGGADAPFAVSVADALERCRCTLALPAKLIAGSGCLERGPDSSKI